MERSHIRKNTPEVQSVRFVSTEAGGNGEAKTAWRAMTQAWAISKMVVSAFLKTTYFWPEQPLLHSAVPGILPPSSVHICS